MHNYFKYELYGSSLKSLGYSQRTRNTHFGWWNTAFSISLFLRKVKVVRSLNFLLLTFTVRSKKVTFMAPENKQHLGNSLKCCLIHYLFLKLHPPIWTKPSAQYQKNKTFHVKRMFSACNFKYFKYYLQYIDLIYKKQCSYCPVSLEELYDNGKRALQLYCSSTEPYFLTNQRSLFLNWKI